jgi:hypothetical protein
MTIKTEALGITVTTDIIEDIKNIDVIENIAVDVIGKVDTIGKDIIEQTEIDIDMVNIDMIEITG